MDYGVLQEDVAKAAEQSSGNYQARKQQSRLRAEQLLCSAIFPGHNKFIYCVSHLPGGPKFLIDMRRDILVDAPMLLLLLLPT
ncbi:hypothetical protein BGZ83_011789 [Gryganskiella cystojenkinii]|nr:hypothetical protein BGZ83_011789 [Gryganskiella cystojenkinii]